MARQSLVVCNKCNKAVQLAFTGVVCEPGWISIRMQATRTGSDKKLYSRYSNAVMLDLCGECSEMMKTLHELETVYQKEAEKETQEGAFLNLLVEILSDRLPDEGFLTEGDE